MAFLQVNYHNMLKDDEWPYASFKNEEIVSTTYIFPIIVETEQLADTSGLFPAVEVQLKCPFPARKKEEHTHLPELPGLIICNHSYDYTHKQLVNKSHINCFQSIGMSN